MVNHALTKDYSVQNFGSVFRKFAEQIRVKLENFLPALLNERVREFINGYIRSKKVGKRSGIARIICLNEFINNLGIFV